MNNTIIKPLIYNSMFEVVFDNNIEVIISLINDCCGTNYNINKDNIKVEKREIPRNNIREIKLICDFIITINKYNIYNIELNKQKYNGLDDRNFTYLFKLHVSRIEISTKYKDFSKYNIKQLNFNKYRNNENLIIDEEGWTSRKTGKKKYENIGILQFDVEFCYNLVYNRTKNIKEIPKLYRWAAIFNANSIEKIDYILGSDMLNMETKKEFLNRITDANSDEIVLSKVSLEEDFEGTIQDTIEYECAIAAQKAKQQGLKQGKEETIINTIKAMLKKNISISDISDISGKSIEEIKEIEKTIQ